MPHHLYLPYIPYSLTCTLWQKISTKFYSPQSYLINYYFLLSGWKAQIKLWIVQLLNIYTILIKDHRQNITYKALNRQATKLSKIKKTYYTPHDERREDWDQLITMYVNQIIVKWFVLILEPEIESYCTQSCAVRS